MVTNAKRLPLSDCCPSACAADPIAPLRSQLTDGGLGVRSDYLCPGCGTSWWTAWDVETMYPEWLPAVQYLTLLALPVAG